MAAQPGKNMLLKVDSDGAGSFQSVAGLRSKSISINSQSVDVTNADSANHWRELLEGAGTKSASVSGSGVFTDATADETVRGYKFNGTIRDWQVIVPDFGTIEGPFMISTLEYAGEHDGEATFTVSLESAGELSWTAAGA